MKLELITKNIKDYGKMCNPEWCTPYKCHPHDNCNVDHPCSPLCSPYEECTPHCIPSIDCHPLCIPYD